MDSLSPAQRSWLMSRIRSKNTNPEMFVRRLIHSMGYRYRLHRKSLPGKPDLVFPSRKKVVFVHGCFWHRHKCAVGRRLPKSRVDYWSAKLEGNRRRHVKNVCSLRALGWKVLTLWECQIKQPERLEERIRAFLEK
jgi:DNA mismatch endonuclease (patch repair protein)